MTRELDELLAVVGESVKSIQADPDMALKRAILRRLPDYRELEKLPIDEAESRMGIGLPTTHYGH